MNEVRRLRVKCEIEQIAAMRARIKKIRDDEDRAIECAIGGSRDASDLLSEIHLVLLVAMDKLEKAKQ